MQKHLASQSKSIVDDFILPNTIDGYDKDVLLATIMRRFSSLPVLYDDPDWFYDECSLWWDENKYAFTKMWEAIETEYKPLENYNRHEEWTRTPSLTDTSTASGSDSNTKAGSIDHTHTGGYTDANTGTDTERHSGKDTTTPSGTTTVSHLGHDDVERQGKTITDTDTLAKSTETAENLVSAYNESTYQESSKTLVSKTYPQKDSKDVPDNTHTETSHQNDKDVNQYNSREETTYTNAKTEFSHGEAITNEHGLTTTRTYNQDKDSESYNNYEDKMTYGKTLTDTHFGTEDYESDVYGNIGVTTSQQMLESEMQLRQKYNLYKIMANTFADDLCLGIW